MAVRELAEATRRADNPSLLEALPDLGVDTATLVGRRGRGARLPVIVVDASAALSAVLNAGPARRVLTDQQLHVPHLIDSEIASGLRRQVIARELHADLAWNALDTWRRLGMKRYPVPAPEPGLGAAGQRLALRRGLRGAGSEP